MVNHRQNPGRPGGPDAATAPAKNREDQPADTVIEGYLAGLSKRPFQVS